MSGTRSLLASRATRTTSWGGVEVPEFFEDAASERAAVVSGIGVHDATALGVVTVRGPDARDFLHRLTTSDVRGLLPGQGDHAVFVSSKGRILFHTVVLAVGDRLLLIHRAPGTAELLAWLDRYHFAEDLEFEDAGDRFRALLVFGEEAREVATRVAGVDLRGRGLLVPASATSGWGEIVAATWWSLGGHPAVLLLVPEAAVEAAFDDLLAAGAVAVGQTAFESLRIASGLPEPFHELTEERNPLEAGLRSAVCFTKGCYVGQEVIARLNTYDKVSRRLVHLRLAGGEPARPGDELLHEGRAVGTISSVDASPDVEACAALGFVKRAHARSGARLDRHSAGRSLEGVAVVGEPVELPGPRAAP